MPAGQGRLPTGVRKKVGRHRRALDQFSRQIRDALGRGRADVELELSLCRGLADELDRLELDQDHSGHTLALVTRTLADMKQPLVARLSGGVESVGLEQIRKAMEDAVAHSTTT